MEYARIPVGLLMDRVPDKDLIAIVKYQLLWAYLEREPAESIVMRYLTEKQFASVQEYIASISEIIVPDINSLNSKRGRDKKYYYKSKEKGQIPSDGTSDDTTDVKSVGPMSQIIGEQINNKTNKKIPQQNKENLHQTGFRGIPLPPTIDFLSK